jgi:hypothetical protein
MDGVTVSGALNRIFWCTGVAVLVPCGSTSGRDSTAVSGTLTLALQFGQSTSIPAPVASIVRLLLHDRHLNVMSGIGSLLGANRNRGSIETACNPAFIGGPQEKRKHRYDNYSW